MGVRDEYADSGRMGASPKSRESCMMDCDYTYGTIAEEKLDDNDSVGSAGDLAGVLNNAVRQGMNRDVDTNYDD